MYKCFNCGSEKVLLQSSFSSKEYGMIEEGLIQTYCCKNCGAEIHYFIPANNDKGRIVDESLTNR